MKVELVNEYKERISSIETQIRLAQSRCPNIYSNKVRLMAVSKTRSIEEINAAYEAGARLFGENHVQEIVEKFSIDGKSSKPKDLELHMIGHLQSNKVNKVVPLVDMIESVDSFDLLKKIDATAKKNEKIMNVLLELNTSKEVSKSGFSTEQELLDCLQKARTLENISIRGLMTVGPVSCSPEEKDNLTCKAFSQLKKLFDRIRLSNESSNKDSNESSNENSRADFNSVFDTLSMGMSGDFLIGVENGSTEVRIGTAIFGERDYGCKKETVK